MKTSTLHHPITVPEKGAAPLLRYRITAIAHKLFFALAVPLFITAVWALAAAKNWLPEQILPSPVIVWQTLVETYQDGTLQTNTLISLQRVAIGFVLGTLAGVLLALPVGFYPSVRRVINPSLLTLSQIPVLGWIPILMIVVGLDEKLKIIVIGWSAFIPVYLNASQGVRDVPERFIELSRCLSFSPFYRFRAIVFPAMVSSLLTGLREGLANSWQTLVVAELLGSFEGLGYLMAYGRQLFQLELVLSAMVVVGALGLICHWLLVIMQKRLESWKNGSAYA